MKKLISRILLMVMLVACFVGQSVVAEEVVSKNPLIDPQKVEAAKTPQRYTNVLLLGIEFSEHSKFRWSASSQKNTLDKCHTDSIMVASINMTTGDVNLVSLPRDTLTYVPSVHGIYKLNAAFNCSDSIEEGFKRIRSAASWLLGGIQIDHFCAVDISTMVALGDYIGGVDLDVEMAYRGSSGRKYKQGMQHLDGRGMMDYIKARKNATVNANDLGRTNRNRRMMSAIFLKLKGNVNLIKKSWDYATSGELNFFTDMTLAKVLNLLNKVKNADRIGSYVLTGKYRFALDNWNFTFTDQANRIDVIKQVYGIEVPELPYVSYEYTKWLFEEGFTTVRYVSYTRDLLEKFGQQEKMTDAQSAALKKLEAALAETIQAFDKAADTMGAGNDQSKMIKARRALRDIANEVNVLFTGEEINWYSGKLWFADPAINEYSEVIWQ